MGGVLAGGEVGDESECYEGEEEAETEEEAQRAEAHEHEDILDYERGRGFEEEIDDRFWEELEADIRQSTEHRCKHIVSLPYSHFLIIIAIRTDGQARLNDVDLQFLREFTWKSKNNVSDKAFRELRYLHPGHTGMLSWKATQERIGRMSELRPKIYDCCVNSCMCYVGQYADLTKCPFRTCQQPRYDSRKRPRRQFTYIPLIPRLKAFLANSAQAERMRYRAEFDHDSGVIKDIFDGKIYRDLLGRHVQPVDGPVQRHRYFDSPTDVALGLSTDGYAPFRRRMKTAWPLLVFNYNLPPEIRFHLDNVMCLGVIPGPNKPKDFDSFLWPLVTELLELELGVEAWDAHDKHRVQLRAFLLLVFGDIPAISMAMKMKGHNGVCPCRFCSIRGVTIPGKQRSPYYVPLDRSHHPAVDAGTSLPSYDPRNLPRRTHEVFMMQARQVAFADTVGEQEKLAKSYGIKGISVLSCLSTVRFPNSFPYDFMHLLWENVVKNLHFLWFGDYKGLDVGTGHYKLPKEVIETIGRESAASGASIPYVFGPSPPNIASDKSSWTADTRSFWTLHIGPSVLRNRLPEPYYTHYMELVKLLSTCLEWDMARDQLPDLREGFAAWVKQYER
jgi:hypothetical protein